MQTNEEIPLCFRVLPLTKHEVYAIKAMRAGEATGEQQQLALQVIINKFARPHDILYDPMSERNSAFLNGRAFVGTQILKMLNVPIGKLNIVGDENEDT